MLTPTTGSRKRLEYNLGERINGGRGSLPLPPLIPPTCSFPSPNLGFADLSQHLSNIATMASLIPTPITTLLLL